MQCLLQAFTIFGSLFVMDAILWRYMVHFVFDILAFWILIFVWSNSRGNRFA